MPFDSKNAKGQPPIIETPGVFEQYSVASWTVKGDTIKFIVLDIHEGGGGRLVRRARPYRKGAKLDSTGPKEKEWDVETIWSNGLDEPGVPQVPPLYPQQLHNMLETVDLDETGTLVLGTRGTIRCRLETYARHETAAQRDCARVTFKFVEDNEDKVDANSFQQPTARATIRRGVDETNFSIESTGSFSDMMEKLETAADQLQEAIAAPGELVQDVDQKAARVIRIVDNVVNQFTVTEQFGRDRLNDPSSHAAVRQAAILKDRAAQAVDEKTSSLPRIINIVIDRAQSIFDISVALAQDPTQLMALNNRIEDFLAIEAGTAVRVFEALGPNAE
jgi:prophage DNA circulation protein